MAKITPIKTAFNAGELSPYLDGRVDIAKYGQGCRRLENFIPNVQGPIVRRPGTRFVAEVKDSTARTWLAKFEFNYQQSFILEMGPLYIRFFLDHAPVVSGMAVYEIASPFDVSHLTNVDGTFGLSMVQSGDVIYITHRDLTPKKLSRLANDNWTIIDTQITGGPFLTNNTVEGNIVTAVLDGGGSGLYDLTAVTDVFGPEMVGTLFLMETTDDSTISQWVSNTPVAVGDNVRNDDKYYVAVSVGTSNNSGYVAPIHTMGQQNDGTAGVNVLWKYIGDKQAIFKIISYTDSTHVRCSLINQLVVGATDSTWAWSKSAWDSSVGFPSQITFFRERLTFARDQKVWFSVAGDFENFAAKEFGSVLADSAISIDIQSDTSSQTMYLTPTSIGLVVGTSDGEMLISESSTGEPFGPTNSKVSQSSGYGARQIKPIRVDSAVLFVQRSGRKVRESTYDLNSDNFIAADITLLSEHITGNGIVDMTFHREPYSCLWACRDDGILLGMTYNKLQDVSCWHRHYLGGSFGRSAFGFVESVQTIPRYDGTQDDLWLIVKRTINGVTKRYIEYLERDYRAGDLQSSSYYVDCGLSYSGSPVTTFSGLDHLVGQTVGVVADGANYGDLIVDNDGSITLDYAVSVVQVGLKNTPYVQTMRLEGGSQIGTAQGKTKRITLVTLRVLNSLGVWLGSGQGNYPFANVDFRLPVTPMGTANPIYSGDIDYQYERGYETDGCISVTSYQHFPITVLDLVPLVTVNDK